MNTIKDLPVLPRQLKPIDSPFKAKQIINPATFQAVTLDDISVKLSKLINLENRRLDLETRRLEVDNAILKELQDQRDYGQELPQNGTVLSTEFTFIDIGQLRQGLRFKSFDLANDDTTNGIYFAWNTTQAGLEPSLDDVTSPLTKFRILNAGDSIKIVHRNDVIQNVSLLGQGGSAVFRLWLLR
jgi:hypothetical protein